MANTKKVLTVGDTACLLCEDNTTIDKYKVVDCGIGLCELSGNWEIGFWYIDKDNVEIFISCSIILDLMKRGILWKEGKEKMALQIRNLRIKQKLHKQFV